jgi:hypothetical protein
MHDTNTDPVWPVLQTEITMTGDFHVIHEKTLVSTRIPVCVGAAPGSRAVIRISDSVDAEAIGRVAEAAASAGHDSGELLDMGAVAVKVGLVKEVCGV